ncbi:hypothetical protein [Kitasatospora sp. NPDC007106]|uniref:hypothetical protein n=1 Tax=Kitasatospora sp. NPDC007106 TaxID=3156914 RepID=UPI0033C9DD7F
MNHSKARSADSSIQGATAPFTGTSAMRAAERAIHTALARSERPQETAAKLAIFGAETAEAVFPHPGQDGWSSAERASNPLYALADALIDATVRRHIEGALADGIAVAEAAEDIRVGLYAAVDLAVERAARGEAG